MNFYWIVAKAGCMLYLKKFQISYLRNWQHGTLAEFSKGWWCKGIFSSWRTGEKRLQLSLSSGLMVIDHSIPTWFKASSGMPAWILPRASMAVETSPCFNMSCVEWDHLSMSFGCCTNFGKKEGKLFIKSLAGAWDFCLTKEILCNFKKITQVLILISPCSLLSHSLTLLYREVIPI